MHNKSQKSNLKSQNFLEKIVKIKKEELFWKAQTVQKVSESKNQQIGKSETRFLKALQKEKDKLKVIAEIKFASPTILDLGSPGDLIRCAKQYEMAGADAISLITERHFFKGDIEFVSQVKETVSLPILQKDFIIDPVQIYDAKQVGTDALLLIARLVDKQQLKKFVSLCFSLGIEPVVEIYNEEDLEKAITTKTNIIAVNARNLETFEINVTGACMLIKKIPNHIIKLGFSGITSQKEAELYKNSGADGILVGTSLMQANDIKSFINDLQI